MNLLYYKMEVNNSHVSFNFFLTSKIHVDDEGWTYQRKPKPVRGPVVSEAGESSEKLLIKDNEVVHAFIDLESTEIDTASAPQPEEQQCDCLYAQ